MKKQNKTIVFIFLIFIFSCSKKNENIGVPSLETNLFTDGNSGYAGDPIGFEITVKTKSLPARLTIIPDFSGENDDCFIDTCINTEDFRLIYYYVISEEVAEDQKTVEVEFKVIQSDKQEVSEKYDIYTMGSAYAWKYTEKLSDALSSHKDSACYYSFNNRHSFSPARGKEQSDEIDFVYYYDNNYSITIASPDDTFVINMDNGTESWLIRYPCKFLLTADKGQFETKKEHDLYVFKSSGFYDRCKSSINMLKINDVIEFENFYGTYGFIKILSFDSITKEIKFQAISMVPQGNRL